MELAKRFSEAKYISLETFRKNGVGVRTTVWLIEESGFLYIRTSPKSGKAKRVRLNPHVRVARSDARGKVQGEWVDGLAKQVEEKESDRIRDMFRKKYRLEIGLLGAIARLFGRQRNDSFVVRIQLANG